MEDTQIIDLYWQRSPAAIGETDKKYGPYCFSMPCCTPPWTRRES